LGTHEPCRHKRIVEYYTYTAYDPNILWRLFFSIVNGSLMRATARTGGIAKESVTDDLRSIEALVWYGNDDYLPRHQNGGSTVEFVSVNEGEMGRYGGDTSHKEWLWWARDHTSGEPLAVYWGTRE
jgi:hypothetical protein